MPRGSCWPRWQRAVVAAILAIAVSLSFVSKGLALITGGEGNEPIRDPGWPNGAAAIFNHPSRVAWWEGPPFGGGQWHAECRGDVAAFNALLAEFAQVDVKVRRLVVHDGLGHSFWLNPNREAAKEAAARIDWTFTVWQDANWRRLRTLPPDLNPTDPRDAEKGPPAQIDLFAGGAIRWADVVVPEGLEVIDERLEAHGFAPADGRVLEGKVIDLATRQPLVGKMRLERIESQEKGGYKYTPAPEAAADDQGRWVFENAPIGWHRIVIQAEGYVPRVIGFGQFDDQPKWQEYNGGLARGGTVSGRVTDDAGKPLADVTVQLRNLAASATDGRYDAVEEQAVQTDAEGKFRFEKAPLGTGSLGLRKSGYVRPGLGASITIPADNVALTMQKAARAKVTVQFPDANRPQGYIVSIEPEGGEAVGKYGGSAQIDAQGQFTFESVPPGKYVFRGKPNPSSGNDHTRLVTVELKGGETTEITLTAK